MLPKFKFLQSLKEVVLFIKGKTFKVASGSAEFEEVKTILNTPNANEEDMLKVVDNTSKAIKAMSFDKRFKIVNGDEVYFKDVQIPVDCAAHAIELHKQGVLDSTFVSFIENLMMNPNKEAIKDLYSFILKGKMPITEGGYFCAYRVCTNDFKDCHSGTFDNSIGATVKMDRSKCDSNRNQTCSTGLHFCSESYVSSFRSGNNRLLMVKINPMDVVAIPNDYNDAKGRCCEFYVVKEIELGSITGVGKIQTTKIVKENNTTKDGVKTCSKCKQTKVLDDFSKDKSTKDGYRCQCKECSKKKSKATKVKTEIQAEDLTIHKTCTVCKKVLSLDSFSNDKSTKDGKRCQCKSCTSERRKK